MKIIKQIENHHSKLLLFFTGWASDENMFCRLSSSGFDVFIIYDYSELEPLQANNPDALIKQIKWVSTSVLKSVSQPPSQAIGTGSIVVNVPMPTPLDNSVINQNTVW